MGATAHRRPGWRGGHGAGAGKIVAALRKRSPRARVIGRGDAGVCREAILAWCERQPEVYYGLGLAKNSVVLDRLAPGSAMRGRDAA